MGEKHKGTIMVVDDNEIVLEVVRTTLEAEGYRVLTREDPAGCVAMLLREEPDLVLIDVAMPELAGDALVRCLGTAQPSGKATVLLHSGLPPEVLEQKTRESGAHGFIEKTSNQQAFARQVASWLEAPDRSGETRMVGLRGGRSPVAEFSTEMSGERTRVTATVLLVDSDMERLSRLRRELQDDGFSTDIALSGAHALGLVTGVNPPDLVVMNTRTEDLSGMEVYRRAVGRDPSWAKRFVFVTAQAQDPAVSSFMRTFKGPSLLDPIHGNELRRAVRSQCETAVRLAVG